MIQSFQHKGLESFFRTGSKAGIQPHHAPKLRIQLTVLDSAKKPDDLGVPGWKLHPLTHDHSGYWSITVNANWRIVFRFAGTNVECVNYMDYH
jgi:proteic killer suppression protein